MVAGDIDWPDPEAGRIYDRMVDYQATRTHFFDEYFLPQRRRVSGRW